MQIVSIKWLKISFWLYNCPICIVDIAFSFVFLKLKILAWLLFNKITVLEIYWDTPCQSIGHYSCPVRRCLGVCSSARRPAVLVSLMMFDSSPGSVFLLHSHEQGCAIFVLAHTCTHTHHTAHTHTFSCKDGSNQLMKRASYSCCIFVCVVLAAAYLKYGRYRLLCIPFVGHFFSL